MKSIVLTGGGTGGHCIPHFAILDLLYKNFDKIYYVGSHNGIEKNLVKEHNLPFFAISPTKLIRGNVFKNLFLPFKFISSINESKKILLTLQPSVVFSKGGYVALPVTIAARKLNIPVIVHESDLTLGLANKIASRYSEYTLTSFKETAKSVNNGVFVGSPIRKELFSINKTDAIKFWGFDNDKPIILITGGSMGAKKLNELILKCLDYLLIDYNILHIVGKGNLSNLNKKGYIQIEYADMKYAYSCCDFCISRAGANTAFELIKLKIPTIFVPLPKDESRGDQIENALYFEKNKLALTLFQENLNIENLQQKLKTLKNYKNLLIENMSKYATFNSNEEICKYLNKY